MTGAADDVAVASVVLGAVGVEVEVADVGATVEGAGVVCVGAGCGLRHQFHQVRRLGVPVWLAAAEPAFDAPQAD